MNPGVKLTPLGRGEAQIRMSALGLFCKREKHIPMYRSKHLGIGKFLLSAQLKYFSPRLQKKKYFMENFNISLPCCHFWYLKNLVKSYALTLSYVIIQ